MKLLITAAALAGLAAWTPIAAADPYFSVNYECKQLEATTDRDGVLCMVDAYMGRPALYIKVLARHDDPEVRVERSRYVIDVMSRNFYAAGGAQVLMRATDRQGREIERYCSRRTRAARSACGDWYPVADK